MNSLADDDDEDDDVDYDYDYDDDDDDDNNNTLSFRGENTSLLVRCNFRFY
jgi:hypothetical protein